MSIKHYDREKQQLANALYDSQKLCAYAMGIIRRLSESRDERCAADHTALLEEFQPRFEHIQSVYPVAVEVIASVKREAAA